MFFQKKKSKSKASMDSSDSDQLQHVEQAPILSDLDQNKQQLQIIFQSCSDVVFRNFRIGGKYNAFLVCVDGLVDMKHVDHMILKPLMYDSHTDFLGVSPIIVLKEQSVAVGQAKEACDFNAIVTSVLYGEAAVFIEGEKTALILDVKGWEMRSIEEPASETVIRGPREGFNENIRTSTSLIRRKLRSPNLKLESLQIGEVAKTEIVIAYVQGIAEDSLVQEVRHRLGRIKLDSVLESGYIEEMIEDAPYSLFPTIRNTERPDVVTANLLEGRVAILVDNTPFVLIVPVTFWSALTANEDYYERFWVGSVIRFIRLGALFISMNLPAIYVGITTYHQEMVPTNLLLSIAGARQAVPFPALVEALIMELTFEALREAGLRLPRQVGQAVSIVGALVIGQSAVQAGIVSAPMVIVVSITAIASFTIPQFSMGISMRILRFILLILSGVLGLYGLTVGTMFILIHLCSLRSFGAPYFAPVAPLNISGLKDIFVRVPWWNMNSRPELLSGDKISERIPKGQKPDPQRGKKGRQPS